MRLRGQPRRDMDTTGPHTVDESVSEPYLLGPGSQLRGQRCLLCGSMIGGQPCRTVAIILMHGGACGCGTLPSMAYLVCADHPVSADTDYAGIATDRWMSHHGPAAS